MTTQFFKTAGYLRHEFSRIIGLYSQWNAKGLFKDLRFTNMKDAFYISFCEHAHQSPIISIHKEQNGPKSQLFIATTTGPRGEPVTIARSEKIDSFIHQLNEKIEKIALVKQGGKNISLL